ncbi:polyphosphate kinase 2 family protein [Longimicrobium terrae]|uniref:PPK2 family polyphosphate:nucleotide phosphotransferase n=1 Tax=Longimicrobium terrae TaxID=1639882 RepID=A0A841GM30_9BACT|nr:polyphosphate kinase 2 family protein [Longimicrobium terrae]MBB4635273.1 PPK2 family polyphosphate:nucleotide phosphotransferase [Longimicrobium terrae]MBB6069667.1 PPK2 family polyphosphate:nucleotide phosphotransferase [Longimicrobium terrae]NNC31122.1 polyphosphate kinase 2 family protein [Longimicrobium terrae]
MPHAHRIEPGHKVHLAEYDTRENGGMDKEKGQARFLELNAELDVIQEELYAAGVNSVLIVLQGMDTSGKDGAIRAVMTNLNPQGCRVESFKQPSTEELSHDFLWRVHRVTPARGIIGVFNRSHYEDVLVARVQKLVPEPVWRARYDQINAFEGMLAASGTLVFKFFLHISKDEQKERLLAREADVGKAWKLSAGDWREREHWDEYQKAYEDAFRHCSTDVAPWYIVPADRKWYRNLAITETLVDALKPFRRSWADALEAMSRARLAELQAFRDQQAAPAE